MQTYGIRTVALLLVSDWDIVTVPSDVFANATPTTDASSSEPWSSKAGSSDACSSDAWPSFGWKEFSWDNVSPYSNIRWVADLPGSSKAASNSASNPSSNPFSAEISITGFSATSNSTLPSKKSEISGC